MPPSVRMPVVPDWPRSTRTAARRIDAAVAAVMANYRAAALAGVTRASIFI
jgi:hypothetical protein